MRCSVEDCNWPVTARGWCKRHYYRWNRLGSPTAGRDAPGRPLFFRFFDKVLVGDGCWEWADHRDGKGYGRIKVKRESCRAHRVSWELWNGPIPEGMHVLHSCDNPSCVRPSHLFLGTHQDNMKDRDAKGRHWAMKTPH